MTIIYTHKIYEDDEISQWKNTQNFINHDDKYKNDVAKIIFDCKLNRQQLNHLAIK